MGVKIEALFPRPLADPLSRARERGGESLLPCERSEWGRATTIGRGGGPGTTPVSLYLPLMVK